MSSNPRRDNIIAEYQRVIQAKESGTSRKDPGEYLYDAFRNEPALLANFEPNFRTSIARGFWVRRSIDGSADELMKVFVGLMERFDPEALADYQHALDGVATASVRATR